VGMCCRSGRVSTGLGYALRVLLACHTVLVARCGHLRISGGEAFSLLRFFVAVGQRNEVPPRTVANSDKENRKQETREGLSSSNPASTPTATTHSYEPTHQTP